MAVAWSRFLLVSPQEHRQNKMLLSKATVLLGIAAPSAFALPADLTTQSTLSTRYIDNHSSDEQTTVSTSWRTRKASATTTSVGDDDGWTPVSKPTPTDIQQTTTVNGTSAQATYVQPNDAIVSWRLAVGASKDWGRFPTHPDDETEACINSTTIDDGTQSFTYDNSTVNCTALMFGDRWYTFECDEELLCSSQASRTKCL